MPRKITIPIEILDRFTAPTRSYEKSMGDISEATKETQDHLKGLQSQAKTLKRFELVTNTIDKTQTKLTEAKVRFGELSEEVKRTREPNETYVRELQLAESALDTQTKKQRVLENQLITSKETIKQKEVALEQLSIKLQDVKKPTDKQKAAVQKATEELTKAKSAHDKLALSVSQTALRHDRAKAKVDKLRQAVEQSKKPNAALVKQFERAKAEVHKLEKSLGDQNKELGDLKRGFDKAGISVDDFASAQKRNQGEIKRTTHLIDKQKAATKELEAAKAKRDNLRSKRGELLAQGAGIAATTYALSRPVAKAVTAEDAFADVIKYGKFDENKDGRLSKKGKQEAAKVQQAIIETSIEKGLSFEETSSLYSVAFQNNQRGSDTAAFAENAANMAIAYDTNGQDAALTLSAWRNSMGLSTERALTLANATNYLSDETAGVFAKDIAGVMAETGSTAMAAGFSETEGAAFSSALLSTGKSQSKAETALKNISITATQGSKATPEAQKALGDIGLNAAQLSEDMKRDAPSAILGVFEAIKNNSHNPEINGIVTKIFGRETIDAVMPLAQNINNLKKSFKAVANEEVFKTSIEKEVRRRMDTRKKEMEKLASAYQALNIQVGNALLPIVSDILRPMIGYATDLANFAERNKELTKTFFGVAAGATAVASAMLIAKTGLNLFKSFGASVGIARAKMNTSTKATAGLALVAAKNLDKLNGSLARTGGVPGSATSDNPSASGRSRGRKRQWLKANKGKVAAATTTLAAVGGLYAWMSSDDDQEAKPTDKKTEPKNSNATETANKATIDSASTGIPTAALVAGAALPFASNIIGASQDFQASNIAKAGGLTKATGLTIAKTAAKRSLPGALAFEAINLGSAVMSGDGENIAGATGSALGTGAAIATGAAIGSVIPGVGTLVGGIVGGIGSLFTSEIGDSIGRSIWNWFDDDDEQPITEGKVNQEAQKIANQRTAITKQSNAQQITYSPNRTYQFTVTENTNQQQIDQIKQKLDDIEQREREDAESLFLDFDMFQANRLST